MKLSNPFVIIIIGPGGSGKGTQGELLADKFDLYLLETSDIIRKNLVNVKAGDFIKVGNKKYDLWAEKEKMDKGIIMDSDLVYFWTSRKIKHLAREQEGIVIGGSPRTAQEARSLLPLLEKLYGKKSIEVILLEVSLKASIFRNSHRRTCELMRHPVLYAKETKNLTHCPLDGSRLIIRGDDKPEIVKIRFKEYQKRTVPVLEVFRKEKIEIRKVRGEQSVAKVFEDILKTLK